MPDAPQMESNTDTSITLVAIEDGEYNIDGGDWQSSPEFEGLTQSTSYTFTQRKKETRSHYASPSSPGAVFSTMPDQINENRQSVFKVFPNPSKSSVTIEGQGMLVITNTLGQTVLTRIIEGKTKVELPQGLYFVKMGNETRKIVVE